MKKILLICSDSDSVINFRKELVLYLIEHGYDVFLIAGDNKREKEIVDLGVVFFHTPFSNRSKNVISSLKLSRQFRKIIKEIKPDIVFTFQIKPNIIGSRAAHSTGIKNIFCMIEGLGDPFQPITIKDYLLRTLVSFLYKMSLKHSLKVFVLNEDDGNELVRRRILTRSNLVLIHGIGIDTDIFKPVFHLPYNKTVLNLSRLIVNKGIIDYCEIAREVRKTRPDISFLLYGLESQLTKKDLQEYLDDGSIFYGEYTNNPSKIISDSRIVVSCSFREGFPRIILEAMALGRAVVATNVIGNREAVKDGETGYLVEPHNIHSFANQIIKIIDDDQKLLSLGKNARKICVEKFDSKIINNYILKIIEDASL